MTPDPEGKVEPLPTILIANDQEWAARSLESLLAAEGFRVVRAYTGRQALERLAQTNPHLVVLDVQMPDLDGFEVCRQLRADPRYDATLPVMITTAGPAGRAQRLEAYQSGAWAFHGQPLDAELVLGQIRAFVAAKAAADRVRESALLDPETGLYNRKGLTQRAQELCSEAHRYRGQLACVVMAPELSLPASDQGNGATGNGNGNGELTALARRIGAMFRRSGRSADAIGRIGRLEFAIVAPQTGATGAEHLVQRFDALLQEAKPPEAALSAPRLRAGYCAISGIERDGLDAEEMLSRASAALALAEPDSRIRAA
ncbi:MAG TPA: response regulator [Gemmatimonadales bacterium]|nr:response regulator [Gemmatimonadales bacterium]